MSAATCTAPGCGEDAAGILMIRYSWRERFRPHDGDGRYCTRHMTYFKPAQEGEYKILQIQEVEEGTESTVHAEKSCTTNVVQPTFCTP